MNFINYGKQAINKDDINAVIDTLESDYLTTGPKIEAFERAISKYCDAKYVVSVSSGTAALHLASLVLLNKGDKVLTTPNSFLATSNAILYAGARPIFVDINEDGNIDLDLCESELKKDATIKALYAVAFSGNMINQEKLKYLKDTYDILILEDCAHAIGACDGDIKAGSCTNSDISIFSFHPVKHITTGEGGAITTNSKALYDKLLLLRGHGISRDKQMEPWFYEMSDLGFNYRLSDIQAALGISQLTKLDDFIVKRKILAKNYDKAFENSLIEPLYKFNGKSSYHLYVIKIDFSQIDITRTELFNQLKERKIGVQVHYIPINRQPYYKSLGYGNEHIPQMDKYYEKCLSIPMYAALDNDKQAYVINQIFEVLNGK